jgi:hypothetical protein
MAHAAKKTVMRLIPHRRMNQQSDRISIADEFVKSHQSDGKVMIQVQGVADSI